jgi:hypothetical protein
MGKPIQSRTHKKSVDASHAGMSTEQVHAGKMAARRSRSQARKKANVAHDKANKKSPADQLAALDFRLGKGEGAKRERSKLITKATEV